MATASASQPNPRVRSIDSLRGLVMIVMALDHVREFFHSGSMSFQPDDLTRTTAALFFTRWVTHFCAPVFMFTAGLGAFLWLRGERTKSDLSVFLWKRGLWLVVLELTVFRFAMNFSLTSGVLLLSILWALGWSMVALGFLVRLPLRGLALLSLLTIALHNLTDPITAAQFGKAGWVWNVLHQPGIFHAGQVIVLAAYPLIPWVAVMAGGFCFGPVVGLACVRRKVWLFRIGVGLTLAFLVIRGINVYGDPVPWSTKLPGTALLSFLKCTKYPPSLDFLLMTLGPAILLLVWLDGMNLTKTNPLIVFGRVPLFFFVVHFLVIHALTIPFAFSRYGYAGFLLGPLPSLGGVQKFPADYGYSLWVIYVVWITVVAMLYPVSLWFARLKERSTAWWLGYL